MIDLATLKQRAPLAETISGHVKLAKRGKTLWGQCPFHREKTASFAVHAEYFHCHGCHANGDVIDFTARIEGVSKGRAIRLLAERFGVPTGPRRSREEAAYMRNIRAQGEFWWDRRRATALRALESACARFFDDQTQRNESLADMAGKYLRIIDEIPPLGRGKIFLALRTAEDNRLWQESREEIKMLGQIFEVGA